MKFSNHVVAPVTPELLARIAKGDAEAFSLLYDQTATFLFTLATRILNSPDEAKEVLQDVYVEVWRKASRFDATRGAPMAWLVTLTRSRAIDRLRAITSRGRSLTDPIDETNVHALISDLPDPFEANATEEVRALIVEAFRDLPEEQQEVIGLAYYEGLSHQEIAARLNKPLGTVKTRIKLGLNRLRYALRPCWEMK